MSNRGRDFKKFDYKYPLVMSASQLATFAGEQWDPIKGTMKEGCERKWAFEKVWRLPTEQKDYLMLGEILHEACERWLEADETGRNEDGTPLNLWPDGWDDQLSHSDSALVRALVEKAIEEGMLRRSAGRIIEAPIQMPVVKREASLIGYVDLLLPDGVEDHKTTSNMRYAKTQEQLGNNTQLLVYAAFVVREWMREHKTLKDLPFVTLRHNVFLKDQDKPTIRPTQAQVPPDHVVSFWDRVVVPSAQKMLHWKKSGLPVTDWEKVPGAKDKGTCRKYGGCPFAGICSRRETPAAHKKRVQRLNQHRETSAQETPVALFDKLKAKQGATPAPETKPEAAPAPEPAQDSAPATPAPEPEAQVEAPAEPAQVRAAAPWANPDCRACKGTGLSRKGTVCKACESANARSDSPVDITSFEIVAGEGVINISAGGAVIAQVQVTAPVQSKDATTPKAAKATKATAKPAEEAPEPEKVEEAVKAPKAKKETKAPAKRGRPKKGFTLLYGSARVTKRDTINLADVMRDYGTQLAESLQARDFFALKAFTRRDALASKAQVIAEGLGSALVFVRPGNPDLDALAAALEPFAYEVLEGGA